MSNREVSTELAEAMIDLVRECESHEHNYFGDVRDRPESWGSEAGQREWQEYLGGVKPAIAKVLDLLTVEVADDVVALIQREQGWRDD